MAAHAEAHAPSARLTPEFLSPPWVAAYRWRNWLIAGGIGAVLSVAAGLMARNDGSFLAKQAFFRAYLLGFVICFGLTLGHMVLLMLQHVTGGKWGLAIRRLLEAGTANIPVMIVMFAPLLIGLKYLYPWTENGAANFHLTEPAIKALQFRGVYMTEPWFFARMVFYFVSWGILGHILLKWSARQDQPFSSEEEYNALRLRFMRLSGGGILFYAITVSLAAVDLVMSLDPVWYSTIWGMMYMAGQALHALAFTICVLVLLMKYEPMKSLVRTSELHDIGKLMLAFVMLYTYLSFSQFIIIWSGNLTEEIPWYIARVRGGWKPVIIGLAAFHFAVPFLLLLNRNLKKAPSRLVMVAAWMVFMRAVDLYWHIYPTFDDQNVIKGGHWHIQWFDVVVPATMFCFWTAMYFWQLGRRPMIPVSHHLVPEILEKSHGAH